MFTFIYINFTLANSNLNYRKDSKTHLLFKIKKYTKSNFSLPKILKKNNLPLFVLYWNFDFAFKKFSYSLTFNELERIRWGFERRKLEKTQSILIKKKVARKISRFFPVSNWFLKKKVRCKRIYIYVFNKWEE